MASWGSSLIRTRRTNLYLTATAAALCSLFYLIGIWTQGGANANANSAAALTCTSHPFPTPTPNSTVTLNFAAHHAAQDLLPVSPAAAPAVQFPRCAARLSDYTPCEDADRSLRFDRKRLVYRERHCPAAGERLRCRIPAPYGYRLPFRWPESREFVWYANVPHKHLTVEKARQNWVRFEGERFRFPGGGTMFPRGAAAYIDEIGRLIDLRGGAVRTAIDTGCGVASWGAYLLSRDILPISFAPKDTHEAQVQFALERGVPTLVGVMASIRLPYPSRAFDIAHCSRCLIPWGQYNGLYLIEVDRILRPGGYWILSGPPMNWQFHWKGWNGTKDDLRVEETRIQNIARSLCWRKLKQKGDLVVWRKATNHLHCKINRRVFKKPSFCEGKDPDKAWYTKMEVCLTPLPEVSNIKDIAGGHIAKWPKRLTSVPPRVLSGSVNGVTPKSFHEDTKLWKNRVLRYKEIDFQLAEHGRYRNILDMNAGLGGFAAALVDDPVWVMNVAPVEAEVNTLGVVFERGLIGTYQSWCEAMSTYPRTYDFVHANAIFSLYMGKCELEDILLEIDRILRPQGTVIIRDDVDILTRVKTIIDGLEWNSQMMNNEQGPHQSEKLLVSTKQYWTAPKLD